MNIAFWILRVLLALHTLAGAAWKFSKSAGETMPSLAAIPNGVWHALRNFTCDTSHQPGFESCTQCRRDHHRDRNARLLRNSHCLR